MVIAGVLGAVLISVVAGTAAAAAAATHGAAWSWDLTAGLDSYLHNYALATSDTTETLTELMMQAGVDGQSRRGARHRWRIRGDASAGTELFRERLVGDYRLVTGGRLDRVRILGSFLGRQYRDTTEYSRSSDNWEGRLEGRVAPLSGSRAKLELRGWRGVVDYRNPSTLEVDYRDTGGGVFVRSATTEGALWGVGARLGGRAYPDSAVIDRSQWSLEGDFDYMDIRGQGIRLYHKSERRVIADETVRPSAWTTWTDARGSLAAARGTVVLELQLESWRYDQDSDVYFNSTRVEWNSGYRWGDILSAIWYVGLAGEHLLAADAPESYDQLGLRGGVESYGTDLGGSLTIEYGRRGYGPAGAITDPILSDVAVGDEIDLYTDFHYFKIWLLANWRVGTRWDLDVMANYEPENHTEQTDDSALGFASVRLRWRH